MNAAESQTHYLFACPKDLATAVAGNDLGEQELRHPVEHR